MGRSAGTLAAVLRAPILLAAVLLSLGGPAPLGVPDALASKPTPTQVFFFSTTNLLLAYSATANAWYPLSLQGPELVRGAQFSGRVVVVATSERILGFSSVTNRWAEMAAIPNEEFLQVDARDDVGWVITSLRSLGFSAFTGDWAEEELFYERGGGY